MAAFEIVNGRNAVAEAQRGRRRVHRVLTADKLGADELTRLAGSPDHQGVIAEVDPFPYAGADELLEPHDGVIVALDQVQDPRNLGAVCRSAEVAGALGVVICERRAAQVTGAVCKSSAGAVEHLRVARVRNLADWLGTVKHAGGWIFGAAADGDANYDQPDYDGLAVLVLGGEEKGIRPRVAAACDVMVSIPQAGRVGSLNVSAAAAVLLFEARRRRR